MVRDGAILAKRGGVSHFSLLTSQGAKKGMWANDWKITHGLLYLKVKGDAEQSVIDQKFLRTSVFRPGWLAREGEQSRLKLDVRDLAATMLYDAEGDPVGNVQVTPNKGDSAVSAVEEKKQEDMSTDNVEAAVIWEGSNIDDVLPLARDNYNATCSTTTAEEKKEDVLVADEKEQDSGGNGQSVEDTEKPQEEAKEEAPAEPKEEAAADDNDNFEVVDKPEDAVKAEVAKGDGDNAENEEFVEVESPKNEDQANVEENNE